MLTRDRLVELLEIDQELGILRWRHSRGGMPAGSIAGSKRVRDSYIQLKIDGRMYLAHRLVWLYVHGRWPNGEVDHINGIPWDNSPSNLREGSHGQNMANYKKPVSNTSGCKGVAFHVGHKRWQAYINSNRRKYFLGWFDTFDEAVAARKSAEPAMHGQFSAGNR